MSSKDTIMQGLYESVVNGDDAQSREWAQKSLEAGIQPLKAIEKGLTPGIREIGDRFGRMEAFLPEMVLAAKAMQTAVEILEPHLGQGEAEKKGKIMVGTVKGDIHDIGKNIAIALLKVNGYEVIDIGRDVAVTDFVDKALELDAQIIGMSGLLTTSLPMMREVIKMLHDDGVRDKFKVIIGGGPTSQEYANEIGADGYAHTAAAGVTECDRLMSLIKNV
jgi:corrinoid protein of di/trimethylamine methyltransferase